MMLCSSHVTHCDTYTLVKELVVNMTSVVNLDCTVKHKEGAGLLCSYVDLCTRT